MLIKDLYTLDEFAMSPDEINATITVNKNHEVFTGHFPGNPVMPGVCMIQIIKELVEKGLEKTLFMPQSSNIKFMALINPEVNSVLNLHISLKYEDDLIKVRNITKMGDVVALKFSGTYIETT
ncbi:3-hydroxyacyl-ACP dehydratase [Flavobacteriaceae bacterium F08102]|nr:3-hydroxyacyl-ACP dehydratase [Flavobacteriaceae bacterium F08102]